jgi:DNA-binding NtrC family response regulator
MKKLLKKINIFILDDDRYYSHFLKMALKNDKYDIKVFQKENKCIEEIKICPDILILDHKLEHTTGLEVLDLVNRMNHGKTKVIYLSAQEHVHIAVKAMKRGAITYIEKSDDTVKEIDKIIQKMTKITNNFQSNIDNNDLRNLSF